MSEALIHCVRIPKSGSTSLSRMLTAAFEGRRTFYLPDTLRPETALCPWQALRLRRSQIQNLIRTHGLPSLSAAFRRIAREARPGDLIIGGHSDQDTVRRRLGREVRFVTLLRDPAERCLSDYHYARAGYLKKRPWQRFDAHLLARVAATYDFSGYLDFQLDHSQVFGNLAARYLGWTPDAVLEDYLEANLWDWATLDTADQLAGRLAERLGGKVAFGLHNRTATVARGDLRADERRRIERLFDLDYQLDERCRADNRRGADH